MTRERTAIDRLADAYTEDYLALHPITAIQLGVPTGEQVIDDWSPDGLTEKAELRRSTLVGLAAATPVDDVDAVTLDAMRERLGVEEDRHAAGLDAMNLNVIESPPQTIRDTIDLMPTESAADWEALARYFDAIPDALAGWHVSLVEAAGRGRVPAGRQVEGVLAQIDDLVGADGVFARMTTRAGAHADDHVAQRVADAATHARDGYAAARERLVEDVLPRVTDRDGCGRGDYLIHSREFLGTTIDVDETYAWGLDELRRIQDEMRAVAGRIRPGATLEQTYAALDEDPRYLLEGTDALQRWMQGKADEALDALSGTHFDIPDEVRRIECCIAPSTTGGIYYTGPSEDFSRPGRMWWSVPKGVTRFGTWRELTTVYHEGVPGHHLQIGQTAARGELLNRWRRHLCWVSGHGEGWALYAERLMAELGFLTDDADRLGMLDAQALRAARVVVDLGVHCGLPAPEEVGGGVWDYEKAWAFLRSTVAMEEKSLRFELDRYLGWPGQAPAYKIGERLWLQLRSDVATAEGDAFSLKAFHRRALDLGSVGLDTLHRALLPRH